MFHKTSTLLFILFLSTRVHGKAAIITADTDRQTFSMDGSCEDQLLKYRRFMLHALINTADVCNTYDLLPSLEFNELQNASEQHVELANYLRAFVQHLTDKEIYNAIEEAVLESCNQKSQTLLQQHQQQQQHEFKRDYVSLGKKQRFHSWGGKRSHNSNNEETPLYFI